MVFVDVGEICTGVVDKTSFEFISDVLTRPAFAAPLYGIWAFTFVVLILVGVLVSSKGKPLITRPNFWWFPAILIVQLLLLLAFYTFPFYLMIPGVFE